MDVQYIAGLAGPGRGVSAEPRPPAWGRQADDLRGAGRAQPGVEPGMKVKKIVTTSSSSVSASSAEAAAAPTTLTGLSRARSAVNYIRYR